MKTKRLIVCLFAFVAFLISQPDKAISEYCWMLGCGGYIGYVFIPETQKYYTPDDPYTKLNSVKYALDTSNLLFREAGISNVNDIVTLNVLTPLLQTGEIEKYKEEIFKDGMIYDKDYLTAEVYRYFFPFILRTSFPMQPDTKLKILSYHSFLGYPGNMPLFALVMVISDG